MLLKHAAAAASLLIGCETLANPPFTFSDNTPAEAAEVNANFDHLDQRLDALEDTSIPVVNVDCTGDPSALQAAIDARPHGRQTINFEQTLVDISPSQPHTHTHTHTHKQTVINI